MNEQLPMNDVEVQIRDLKNTVNFQKMKVADLRAALDSMAHDLRQMQRLLRWFRDNYSYDTREAAVLDLLLSNLSDALDRETLSDIPF